MRASIPEGAVTLKTCNSVLPFDNDMMLVEASGATVLAALENGVSYLPGLHGKFAQPAGITYTADLTKEAGKRVSDVTLKDGTKLDPDKRYKVVINSFIAGGGDGYSMFNVLNEEAGIAEDVKIITHVNKTYMRHALQAYFEKSSEEKPITVDLNEVRIKLIEHPFTDINNADWFYSDVVAMYKQGIINGMTATTFEPQGNLTRAQAAMLLYRLAGEPETEGTSSFTDVPKEAWYAEAIAWAQKNEIVNGMTATTFEPDSKVTRAQFVVMLYRFAGKPENMAATTFTDVTEEWYIDAVSWAETSMIVNGMTATTFEPNGHCTRAQAAKILCVYLKTAEQG